MTTPGMHHAHYPVFSGELGWEVVMRSQVIYWGLHWILGLILIGTLLNLSA